jgi:hypothetical protein
VPGSRVRAYVCIFGGNYGLRAVGCDRVSGDFLSWRLRERGGDMGLSWGLRGKVKGVG